MTPDSRRPEAHQIPWQVRRLGDLAEILDHLRIPVNSEERDKRLGNVPYYGANGIQGYIDKPLFNEPLVLLAEDGGNFDDFASRPVAYRIDGPSWVNNHAHILRSSDAATILGFLFHALEHRDIRRYISGGTRGKLTQAELRAIEVLTPPTVEQVRIAEVLDTLDEAIRCAEEALGKREMIANGIVQQVFAGKGEQSGISAGWRLEALGDLCERVTDGTHQAVQTTPEGLSFLFVSCIRNGRIHWNQAGRIQPRTYEVISPGRVPKPEAVLYTAVGSYGHAAVVETSEPFGFQRHIAILYPTTKQLSSYYLAEWLNSEEGRRIADRVAIGNAQKTVTLGALGKFPIPIPGDALAQESLVAPIRAARAEILQIEQELLKLQAIKAGISSDLLTGRVRTRPQ